ncbi:MAG: ATP-binding protein [Actinomycetota bacterium]
MHLPIRARLTLLFAILAAMVLGGVGAFVHIRFREDIRQTIDAGLRSRAQSLLAGIDDSNIQFGDEGNLIEPDEAFAQILSSDGVVLEASPGFEGRLLVPQNVLARLRRATYVDATVVAHDEHVQARLLAVPSGDGPIVVVGSSLEQQNEATTRLTSALLLGGSAALFVITLIGWIVAGAALRPVDRMRAEADQISADEPGRRLQVPQTRDEVARLGATLNDMLARLELAIERERRFVDDASHELRTPLGILRTELELALRKARTHDELEMALRSAAEESDRLNRLAEDLLVLARADHGRLPVRRERVDMLALARDVRERYSTPARSRGIEIEVVGPDLAFMDADQTRMDQALANLVDNALRNSPSGGLVQVVVNPGPGSMSISVSDQGDGFPEEFLERAFEPFARVDAARARSSGGAGLGLAIVRAVAEGHGGRAYIENHDAGAIVTIQLPPERSATRKEKFNR